MEEPSANIKFVRKTLELPPSGLNAEQINILKERPCSPHLTIYHWELPGLMSGSHRVTGHYILCIRLFIGACTYISIQ